MTTKPKAASAMELSGSLRSWKLWGITEQSEIERILEQREIRDPMWES
jgi:hypothetical protein